MGIRQSDISAQTHYNLISEICTLFTKLYNTETTGTFIRFTDSKNANNNRNN